MVDPRNVIWAQATRNNHCFDLAEHFEKMFKDESMVDVTLSCGDGIIKAHKMILSACSSYFKNIFTKFNNPYQYPIVIIKDMPFEDLRAIIEFIYRGEVTVAHNNLKSVLRSAEALKVKGLSDARRQMEGDESLASMRKKKRKRRRKSRKMGHGDSSKTGEMDDENGERNAGSTDRSGADKGKDDNTTEEDDATDYSEEDDDDDETEKEDDNTTTSIIITERETTNTEGEIEPARLLEQSMITGDQDRASNEVSRFQAPMMPHHRQTHQQQQQQSQQLSSNISQAMRGHFGESSGLLAAMNVSSHSSSLPNSQSQLNSSHSHVPGIPGMPSYEASSLSMPGPSTISPITPRPIHHGQEHNSGSSHSSHPSHPNQVPQNLQSAQLLPPIQMHPSLGCHSFSPLSVDSLTGKRHYQCPECFKTFTEKGNMKRHTQIHSQNRNRFMCDLCSKCFAWKDNFNRHRRIAHSELNYEMRYNKN